MKEESMSVISPPTGGLLQPPQYPLRPFTVDEYHRMIEVGVLTEDDPVELLEGRIVLKMPRNPPHDSTIAQAQDTVNKHLPPGWHVRVQSAITLSDSEPEPDVGIARGQPHDYATHHPGPVDIAALIEVADSSLDRDRNLKGPLYARARIPVYWIINLVDSQVEVYTDPSGPGAAPCYHQRQDYDNAAVPLVIAGQVVGQIPVRD
jgi:Uma2 family endonuclease